MELSFRDKTRGIVRLGEETHAAMQMEELKKPTVKALPDLSFPRLHSSSSTTQSISVCRSENYVNPNTERRRRTQEHDK